MPRKVEITLPSAQTDEVMGEINKLDEVISMRLQHNISLNPQGDVISVEVTDRSLHSLMQLLAKHKMLQDPKVSVTTSQPLSIISQPSSIRITNDASEATWEEMQATINRESHMTANGMLTMAISGVIAAIGISTNALHLVIGAMVIAPGFEPFVHFSLGFTTSNIAWRRGLFDIMKGYGVMIIAAAITALVLQALEQDIIDGKASYLAEGSLASYWTKITVTSLIVSAVASIAGTVIIIAHRSILTAGVMIALALVPSATILGMALISGEFAIAEQAALRWLLEVVLITVLSAMVFLWKKASVHRRNMWS